MHSYQIVVAGIPLVFATREDLDDALLGFVEPSLRQIEDVDRALAREGIFMTRQGLEWHIKESFLAAKETTSSAYYREP